MLESDIKVIRQVEDTRYKFDGTPERFIRVEFMVGTHGPFVERLPKEGYSAITRDDKLSAFAREVRTP